MIQGQASGPPRLAASWKGGLATTSSSRREGLSLYGGRGRDRITGAAGPDRLIGGRGRDLLFAGSEVTASTPTTPGATGSGAAPVGTMSRRTNVIGFAGAN